MRYRQLIHHARRDLGFTLIELVVVVAIITVLLAILLPSMKGARDQARAVQCASNLRQWGLAIQSYASEENDTIPAVAAANPGTIWSSSTVAGNASRAQLSADKISRYMGNFCDPGAPALTWSPTWSMGKVFICPAAYAGNSVTPSWTNFGVNGLSWQYYMYFGRADLLTQTTHPKAFFTQPDDMVNRELTSTRELMSDFVGYSALSTPVWNFNHGRSSPAPILGPNAASSSTPSDITGWNVLYGDAHVEWEIPKLQDLESQTYYSSSSVPSFWLANNGKLFY